MPTGRVAAFYGPGKPMQIKEYVVCEPDPGGIVVKMTVANVCGSDLHQWRGGVDVGEVGRPYPQIPCHQKKGATHQLREGGSPATARPPPPGGGRGGGGDFFPC